MRPKVYMVRERVSPHIAENSYIVFVSVKDDFAGHRTRRFWWRSDYADAKAGDLCNSWQAARGAAARYAKALAAELKADLCNSTPN